DVRKTQASEKLSDRQGRGVRAGNHDMVRLSDQYPFLLSLTSPQDEYHSSRLRSNQFDKAIGEPLPAAPLMRIGLVRPNREDRVEHEDALSSPGYFIFFKQNTAYEIILEFPEDISQRERQR